MHILNVITEQTKFLIKIRLTYVYYHSLSEHLVFYANSNRCAVFERIIHVLMFQSMFTENQTYN